MNKVIVAAFVATVGLCAGSAQAGNVSWSIGINTPFVGTVVSNEPYYAAPAYIEAPRYVPAPVYVEAPRYVPAPVYVEAPRVVPVPVYVPVYRPGYRPVPVGVWAPGFYPRYGAAYRPVPVAYGRGGGAYGWNQQGHHDDHHGGRDDRGDRRHSGHD
jgi:hypothetical protein